MNYIEFHKTFINHPVIDTRNVVTYFNSLDRRRLYEWQKKGYIRKITNRFYIFSETDVDGVLLKNIASQIYQPSYIGLESALAYYNFIPEAVFQTISITTRRNKYMRTVVGDFRYRSIKKELFFGYRAITSGNRSFLISDPEKTLLDMFYFVPGSDQKDTLREMRLNAHEMRSALHMKKMRDYLALFSSPKVDAAFRNLKELVND